MPAASRQSRHLPAFILLTLMDGPLHGHAIRAELHAFLPGYKADPGATYRTLKALEEAGEVTFEWDTDARGPARKVYTLTAEGWAKLEQWKADIQHRMEFLQRFLERFNKAKGKRPKGARR